MSFKNNWIDKEGRVFIYFTVEEIMKRRNISKPTAIKTMNELDSKKGIGLIERVRFVLGKPNVIYVKDFMSIIAVKERNSKQKIQIYFNFIGNYEPPKEELTEEERLKLEEEERKINEKKDRLHQNYLKRKANGKQQEYEERYKARREQKEQEKLKVLERAVIPKNGNS